MWFTSRNHTTRIAYLSVSNCENKDICGFKELHITHQFKNKYQRHSILDRVRKRHFKNSYDISEIQD